MVYWHHFFKEKHRRAEMRHNVLVYLSCFYDENVKYHDRLWRTNEVFWNFFITIYEIFVFSETVVFFPEKHFGKIWSKSIFWLRHTSWSQDIFKHKYKVHCSFYLPMIRDIQIVLGNVLITHLGLSNFFLVREQLRARFPVVRVFSATV